MKKISSITTHFRKVILPIILIINVFVILCCIKYLHYQFKDLILLIFGTIIFAFAWLFSFRKLQVVYLGDTFLKVKEKKIFFEEIISIEKKNSFVYKVTYQINNKISSFIFMVDYLPFRVPYYVKEIKKNIEKRTNSV